jgi:hypothetical protein
MLTTPATWQQICDRIVELFSSPGVVLFAGAGVGQRAGLLSWQAYIEYLAEVAERHEPESAKLIRLRARAGQLAEAVDFYKLAKIPDAEKYRALAAPFKPSRYNSHALNGLVSLPFSYIITTNFDRSLLDAWSDVYQKAPIVADLNDPTLQSAIFASNPFIARIHGREEVPETMVLGVEDFRRLASNDPYVEFLLHTFRHHRCLIIGYSFLDPAITNTLRYIRETAPRGSEPTHVALLPEGSDALAAALTALSVECVPFSRSALDADEYAALWGGVTQAARRLTGRRRTIPPPPLDTMRHLLANAYVRARMTPHLPALTEVILEGALLGALSDSGDDGATVEQLAAAVQEQTALTLDEARSVIETPLDALMSSRSCRKEGDKFYGRRIDDRLGIDLDTLAEATLIRLDLRRGGRTHREAESDASPRDFIRETLEYALLSRGWDLGAEFAGIAMQSDHLTVVSDFVEDRARNLSTVLRYDITAACIDLLLRPTESEARILAQIGRLAFAVNIIVQTGRGPLLHRRVLPERIYLDANVAMPAMVPGHPLKPVYTDALAAWHAAAVSSGKTPRLLLGDVFMNEILRHRELALRIVADQKLDDEERLSRYIRFYGAQFANVFVSAYSTSLGRAKTRPPFRDWLHETAPYADFDGLTRHLDANGIEPVRLGFDATENDLFNKIRAALQISYDDDERSAWDPKPTVLIGDEARQLTRLTTELQAGRKTLFVSADRRLRRLSTGRILGTPGSATISAVALVELVDLLVGVNTEPRSLYRLMSAIHSHDEALQLRNYLTELALRRQEEAIVMTLPSILDAIVTRSVEVAHRTGVKFWSRQPDDQATLANYLDEVENEFYEALNDAVTKYERD